MKCCSGQEFHETTIIAVVVKGVALGLEEPDVSQSNPHHMVVVMIKWIMGIHILHLELLEKMVGYKCNHQHHNK